MRLALKLAENGRKTVAPNPMVGCVIVKHGEIVGSGWHQKAGGPHAEIFALNEAKEKAKGSTIYVSLEPCSHQGRTPPCVDALIRAKVAEVHFPFIDPNPDVSGEGMAKLKAAGINVVVGEYEQEARAQNEIFMHYIQHKTPFIIAKWAMSLDGQMITHSTDSRQITGQVSQGHLHNIRESVSAILIGSETAIKDNPVLTSRLEGAVNQPVRIILNASGNLPLNLKIFDVNTARTIVATKEGASKNWCHALMSKGVEILQLPINKAGIDLHSLVNNLGRQELSSMLVEGGPTILNSFFQAGLVNKVYAYLAPVIISNMPVKQRLAWQEYMQLGDDFFFAANLKKD